MSKKKTPEAEEEVKETAEEAEETAEAVNDEEQDPKDKEIASLKDQLMRNMAEYDNYRKRTARERIELQPEITAKTVGEFLTVLDGLERALQSECSDENFKKGIEMLHENFISTLQNLGVEEIPTDKGFDPSMHQAVQQVPAADGQESGDIASVFQKGYKLGDRILRFAMVAVVQ
ncbi:MAG: nucleotide exchange factor GrpE [Oscillospiraceae bacterium]|nr:nucleotide exchange factor GrpE [Oscillospiraceae bacterium]